MRLPNVWSPSVPVSLTGSLTLRRRLEAGLDVTYLDVSVPDLPAALDGFRIGQFSDLHIGPGPWRAPFAGEAARQLRAAHPDVLVCTGDFMQEEPPLDRIVNSVRPFVLSPAPDAGIPRNLAIPGNHDYFTGRTNVHHLAGRLSSLGVCMLINQTICVHYRGAEITFAGLTDHEPGLECGIEQLLSSSRPRIALVHEPDLACRIPAGAADLVLAGHTHGGQIGVPGLKPVIVKAFCGSNFVEGMYSVNEMPVYVNRGIGFTGMVPIRILARPEVTLIRLVR